MLTSWEEIVIASRGCPWLYRAVQMVENGVTKEEALASVALGLSRDRADYVKSEHERLMREPGPTYIFDPRKR